MSATTGARAAARNRHGRGPGNTGSHSRHGASDGSDDAPGHTEAQDVPGTRLERLCKAWDRAVNDRLQGVERACARQLETAAGWRALLVGGTALAIASFVLRFAASVLVSALGSSVVLAVPCVGRWTDQCTRAPLHRMADRGVLSARPRYQEGWRPGLRHSHARPGGTNPCQIQQPAGSRVIFRGSPWPARCPRACSL